MRNISTMAVIALLVLWGAYFYLKDSKQVPSQTALTQNEQAIESLEKSLDKTLEKDGSLLTAKRKRDLDKIGAVINDKTVKITDDVKKEIKTARAQYDTKEALKELLGLLEQSYLDRNSAVKDIKRIQNQIIEIKNKLKEEITNTERWDPRFVYYLMIQENYTFNEINQIKSLATNGLSNEEVEYINELIREEAFSQKIQAFKAQGEINRAVASFKKSKPKEKDDFIDEVSSDSSAEDKLIEMNYNQAEKEEMIYGNNQ